MAPTWHAPSLFGSSHWSFEVLRYLLEQDSLVSKEILSAQNILTFFRFERKR